MTEWKKLSKNQHKDKMRRLQKRGEEMWMTVRVEFYKVNGEWSRNN